MSFLELKGRLVTEASCLHGNAKESCGVCNTKKKRLFVAPQLHCFFGGKTRSPLWRRGSAGGSVPFSVLQIKGQLKCCSSHQHTPGHY